MAKNNNLTDFLTGVADAIRTKKGTTDLINPQDFESEIASIKTEKPEQEKNVTVTENGTTEVVPDSGKALSKVTVMTNVQPTLQEKTVAPATTQQIVTADSGKYGLSKVTVGAVTAEIDSNIIAENIKKGITILGVTGTLESGTPIEDALVGTWVFNDNLIMHSLSSDQEFSIQWLVNFTVAGDTRNFVRFDADAYVFEEVSEPPIIYELTYKPYSATPVPDIIHAYSNNEGGWQNENYKTITITSKLSEVTNGDALLTWLQANATKQ